MEIRAGETLLASSLTGSCLAKFLVLSQDKLPRQDGTTHEWTCPPTSVNYQGSPLLTYSWARLIWAIYGVGLPSHANLGCAKLTVKGQKVSAL